MHFPTDMTAHTTAFDIPVVGHWLNMEVKQSENGFDPVLQAPQMNILPNKPDPATLSEGR